MVQNFKIEVTKISFKKLEILIEQWTNKNIHIFENISQSSWFIKMKLQFQSVFYPMVVTNLKVTEIQIVFSISSHQHKRKPKLSAELLHRQFRYSELPKRMSNCFGRFSRFSLVFKGFQKISRFTDALQVFKMF